MQTQSNEQTLVAGLSRLGTAEFLVAGLLQRAFPGFNKTAIEA